MLDDEEKENADPNSGREGHVRGRVIEDKRVPGYQNESQ
jgi:hypothetical protein